MPLSREQTVVRGKALHYTSPTLQSAPCRDYPTESSKMSAKVMEFKMEMTCDGCANAARQVLAKLGDKVTKVDTDIDKQTVTVTTNVMSPDEILTALEKTGKKVAFVKMS